TPAAPRYAARWNWFGWRPGHPPAARRVGRLAQLVSGHPRGGGSPSDCVGYGDDGGLAPLWRHHGMEALDKSALPWRFHSGSADAGRHRPQAGKLCSVSLPRPDHPYAYRWLAAALGQLGRGDEAQAVNKAIETAPDSFRLYVEQRVPWMEQSVHDHML